LVYTQRNVELITKRFCFKDGSSIVRLVRLQKYIPELCLTALMLKDLQSMPLLLMFKVQKSAKFEFKTSDSKLKSLEKCFSDRTTNKEPLMYILLKLKTWPMVFRRLPLNKLELTVNWFKDVRFPRLEGMESEDMFSVRPTCCRC